MPRPSDHPASLDRQRRPGRRRRVAAAAAVVALIAVGTGAVVVASRGDQERRAQDRSVEVEGPVAWSLLGSGTDGRSLVIQPLAERGDCQYSWATAESTDRGVRIRASIRDAGCRGGHVRDLAAYRPEPITVPIPDGGGRRSAISGPRYQGVASRDQLRRYVTRDGRGSCPSVEGLRWATARQILQGVGIDVSTVGPTTQAAIVETQWPPPAAPFEYEREPRAKPRSGEGPMERSLRRHGLAKIPAALLATSDPATGVSATNLPAVWAFTCRQIERHSFSAEQRETFQRQIPTTCGGQYRR